MIIHGMMWFDNSKSPLSVKIEGAISYYEKKYGHTPNVVAVHPSTEIDDKIRDGIAVQVTKTVLPNNMLLGMEESYE